MANPKHIFDFESLLNIEIDQKNWNDVRRKLESAFGEISFGIKEGMAEAEAKKIVDEFNKILKKAELPEIGVDELKNSFDEVSKSITKAIGLINNIDTSVLKSIGVTLDNISDTIDGIADKMGAVKIDKGSLDNFNKEIKDAEDNLDDLAKKKKELESPSKGKVANVNTNVTPTTTLNASDITGNNSGTIEVKVDLITNKEVIKKELNDILADFNKKSIKTSKENIMNPEQGEKKLDELRNKYKEQILNRFNFSNTLSDGLIEDLLKKIEVDQIMPKTKVGKLLKDVTSMNSMAASDIKTQSVVTEEAERAAQAAKEKAEAERKAAEYAEKKRLADEASARASEQEKNNRQPSATPTSDNKTYVGIDKESLKSALSEVTYNVKIQNDDTDKGANKITLDEGALKTTLQDVFGKILNPAEQDDSNDNGAQILQVLNDIAQKSGDNIAQEETLSAIKDEIGKLSVNPSEHNDEPLPGDSGSIANEQQTQELTEQQKLVERYNQNKQKTLALLKKEQLSYEEILYLVKEIQTEYASGFFADKNYDLGDEAIGLMTSAYNKLRRGDMIDPRLDKAINGVGISAEDGARILTDYQNRQNGIVEDISKKIQDIDDDDAEFIERENGTIEDKLERLQQLSDDWGNKITQKNRDRLEELNQKDMDSGLTTKEEERMSELYEQITEADEALEEFGQTYDKIILKLGNGKKVEIFPDDKGLRDLYTIGDEYGESYKGVEIEDVVFERVKKEVSVHQENADAIDRERVAREHLNDEKEQQVGVVDKSSDLDTHIDGGTKVAIDTEALRGVLEQVTYNVKVVQDTDAPDSEKAGLIDIDALKSALDQITYDVKIINDDTDKNANKIAIDESALEQTLNRVFTNILNPATEQNDGDNELLRVLNEISNKAGDHIAQEKTLQEINSKVDNIKSKGKSSDINPHYVTDATGKPVEVYRGIRDSYAGGVSNSKHGGTFTTDDIELAKLFAGENGKIEKSLISMKNPLEIDANGADYNKIAYLGNGIDETSKTLIRLQNELTITQEELQSLYEIIDKISSDQNVDASTKKYYEGQLKDTIDKNANIQSRMHAIFNDKTNPYNFGDTNKFVEIAKQFGYDGVIFKNVKDGLDKTSNIFATLQEDQIHYIKTLSSESNYDDQHVDNIVADAKITPTMEEGAIAKLVQENVEQTPAVVKVTPVIDSAEDSAKAIDGESQEAIDAAKAFVDAAKAKKEFVKANQLVAESAEESESAVKREAKAVEHVAGIADGDPKKQVDFFMGDNTDPSKREITTKRKENNAVVTQVDTQVFNKETQEWLNANTKIIQDFEKFAKEADKTQATVDRAKKKLGEFLARFQSKTGGKAELISGFNELKAIFDDKNGVHANNIESVFNQMTQLQEEYAKLEQSFRKGQSSLNPFVNAINKSENIENIFGAVEVKFNNLLDKSEALTNNFAKLRQESEYIQKFTQRMNVNPDSITTDEFAEFAQRVGQFNVLKTQVEGQIKNEGKGQTNRNKYLQDLTALYVEAEQTRAKYEISGSQQELEHVNNIRLRIEQMREVIGLTEDEIKLLEQKSKAAYEAQQRESLGAKADRDNKKDLRQQIKDSRDAWRVNRANSVFNSSRNVKDSLGLIPEEINGIKIDVSTFESVQKLNMAIENMVELRKVVNQPGHIVTPEEGELLKQYTLDMQKYSSQVKELVANYERFNDENSTSLKATFTGGDVKAQLEAAVQSYERGAVSIKNYNEATRELTYEVKTGTHEFTTYTVGIRDVDNAIRRLPGTLRKTETFMESFQRKFAEITRYFSASSLLFKGVNELRKGIQYIKEIDAALVELRKVTDKTEAEYDEFLNTASKTADRLGSTISAVTEATATFAKLGYTMEMAAEMAEAAIVYKNVGDNIASTEDAANSIISTLKGFGLEASEAMRIVDRFNEVGNKFAITSQGLGEALRLSASALSEGGNTLDESIGIITAANEVVNDPSSVGTALKTLTLRLRGSKTELEEMGEDVSDMATTTSQLQAKLLALTGGQVDIMLDQNTFKSSTQILREMADAWESMTDIQQASALELMGGKRQAKRTNCPNVQKCA